MSRTATYFKRPLLRHILFWVIVYLYFVLSVYNVSTYASYRHLFEYYGLIVTVQMIAAYSCICFLMPKFLDRKKFGLFIFLMLVLLIFIFALYYGVRTFYFDVQYFDSYSESQQEFAQKSYLGHMNSFPIFLSKAILFLTPTALLLMSRFYGDQKKLLQINEQKKIAELNALKQQLNPHFLFNTLNNLYALALEKSDRTPEVIERLSDMLDYMLYRCNSKYVLLQKEIELIENYLALEKIRYGDRVIVTFDHQVKGEVKIAPLLLLTFIENAFKHGVRQELKQASIDISLSLWGNKIIFNVENSKPNAGVEKILKKEAALGLNNVKRQLELVYLNAYDLQLKDEESKYSVQLKIEQK